MPRTHDHSNCCQSCRSPSQWPRVRLIYGRGARCRCYSSLPQYWRGNRLISNKASIAAEYIRLVTTDSQVLVGVWIRGNGTRRPLITMGSREITSKRERSMSILSLTAWSTAHVPPLDLLVQTLELPGCSPMHSIGKSAENSHRNEQCSLVAAPGILNVELLPQASDPWISTENLDTHGHLLLATEGNMSYTYR
ncbi:hypothetical protein K431DRAFT_11854 [Polychaeton citri CBS 116435]|uniref:Uncharacterized protein n=1 Tax=Polychaeton citri CBS 116435 TaxID=1314669 RepID=A0A9P4PZE6_9PEZI|nr:hypothetical protein K431DRAFT_11854 [Polychaeton citri CBS 116435]